MSNNELEIEVFEFFKNLASKQISLDPEFLAIVEKNLWDLYEE